jgi:integrase/recombinase XerD
MTKFYAYQFQKGVTEKTAKQQMRVAENFEKWCKMKGFGSKKINYARFSRYVNHLLSEGNKQNTISFKVKCLAHYFDYLQVKINVAQLFKMKGSVRKIIHNCLENEEIETLYTAQKQRTLLQKRDKIIVSLVVFQALTRSDLERIEVQDLELQEGMIYIKSSRSSNARNLALTVAQTLQLLDYLAEVRPKLEEKREGLNPVEVTEKNERLFFSTASGKQGLNNVIAQIIERIHLEFPKFKNLQQIRQSVIKRWVKEKGVRQAQYLAGHRFVSSTERYNEDANEVLKLEIKMFHPLNLVQKV